MIVAIIGPDGCGKTTQAKMLVDRLNKNGYNAVYVHTYDILSGVISPLKKVGLHRISPRNFRESKLNSHGNSSVRKVLIRLSVATLGFLYALATYVYIRIILGRSRILVCDRYFFQFFFDLFDNYGEKVMRIFPKPDVTVLLDGDPDVFYSRMTDALDRSTSKDYYTGLIELYRRLAKDFNFVKIDATLEVEAVNNLILKNLMNYLEEAS